MKYNFGAIGGAITDVNSDRARSHAKLYYEEIRKMTADVDKIAKNTVFTYSQILLVKNYLFTNKQNLGDGRIDYFDACFEIAQSWRRLMDGKYAEHDLMLIHHELCELDLVMHGFSQQEAHDITNLRYNYSMMSKEFYKRLIDSGKSVDDIISEEQEAINGKNVEHHSG